MLRTDPLLRRRRVSRSVLVHLFAGLVLLMVSPCDMASAAGPAIPKAFGPHIGFSPAALAEVPSFSATQKIVGTYYFYWYSMATKEHIIDWEDKSDALTDHPADTNDFSYASVSWHERQLTDMMAAGIDVVLPVFWGAPSEHATNTALHWSYAGIPKLVEARERLLSQGKRPPRIGMFYDTSTLQYNQWNQHIDLTTDYGRQWFYATVRDFFSMVPPQHWALIDGHPIVLLYAAAFATKHDQSVIDYTKEHFAADFGGRPWIAREVSWRVKADDTVAWGGALGVKNPGVASIGPGYDHSAVPGRTPLIVDRRGGAFYEENWIKLLRRPPHFVMVETWNEFHEGTDVAESREYGRQYITLTRKFSDLFKQGWQPAWPSGKYNRAAAVAIALGASNRVDGIVQIENDDGQTEAVDVGTHRARIVKSRGPKYMYFSIDDSFKTNAAADFSLEIDYQDTAPGTLGVEFDGSDPQAAFAGAYSRSPDQVKLAGDQQWKKARFVLPQARFLNSQNRGADFRLLLDGGNAAVERVTIGK